MLIGRLPFSNSDVKILFNNIVNDKPEMPLFLSSQSRSLIAQLLEKNPNKRLGSSKLDSMEIQMHQFFTNINWNSMLLRKLEPPFRPLVDSDVDTRYFEKAFTGENVQLTPTTSEDIDFNDFTNKNICVSNKNLNHFDSFSYYGSINSLNAQKSNQVYRSESSLEQQQNDSETNSVISMIDQEVSPPSSLNEDDDVSATTSTNNQQSVAQENNNLFYPYLVQYTDINGQIYESQTFAINSNNVNNNNNNNNMSTSTSNFNYI